MIELLKELVAICDVKNKLSYACTDSTVALNAKFGTLDFSDSHVKHQHVLVFFRSRHPLRV